MAVGHGVGLARWRSTFDSVMAAVAGTSTSIPSTSLRRRYGPTKGTLLIVTHDDYFADRVGLDGVYSLGK